MKDVSELRSTFLQLWQESQELESKRVFGIYTLYEEIVKSNQSVYGAQVLKQFQAFKKSQAMNSMFQFKAIVREKELDAFCNLCFAADYRPDLNNVTSEIVSKVLSVQLPKAPLHKQVQKVAYMK